MDRDRRLAEMTGMWDDIDGHTVCPNFSTPEWRARLRDEIGKSDDWPKFWKWARWKFVSDKRALESSYGKHKSYAKPWDFDTYLWRNLPSLLVEYHGEGR